jgi:hypothetical protein
MGKCTVRISKTQYLHLCHSECIRYLWQCALLTASACIKGTVRTSMTQWVYLWQSACSNGVCVPMTQCVILWHAMLVLPVNVCSYDTVCDPVTRYACTSGKCVFLWQIACSGTVHPMVQLCTCPYLIKRLKGGDDSVRTLLSNIVLKHRRRLTLWREGCGSW